MNCFFSSRDIATLFKKLEINEKNEILYGNTKSVMYQVLPITVIEPTAGQQEKVYNAFLNSVKTFPDNLQIITLKDNIDFSDTIYKVKNNISSTKSDILKQAMEKYIEQLYSYERNDALKITKFYMVLPQDITFEDMQIMYKKLKELGLGINKITDKNELKKLLRKCILQC